jgi:hypothetical protein
VTALDALEAPLPGQSPSWKVAGVLASGWPRSACDFHIFFMFLFATGYWTSLPALSIIRLTFFYVLFSFSEKADRYRVPVHST